MNLTVKTPEAKKAALPAKGEDKRVAPAAEPPGNKALLLQQTIGNQAVQQVSRGLNI